MTGDVRRECPQINWSLAAINPMRGRLSSLSVKSTRCESEASRGGACSSAFCGPHDRRGGRGRARLASLHVSLGPFRFAALLKSLWFAVGLYRGGNATHSFRAIRVYAARRSRERNTVVVRQFDTATLEHYCLLRIQLSIYDYWDCFPVRCDLLPDCCFCCLAFQQGTAARPLGRGSPVPHAKPCTVKSSKARFVDAISAYSQ